MLGPHDALAAPACPRTAPAGRRGGSPRVLTLGRARVLTVALWLLVAAGALGGIVAALRSPARAATQRPPDPSAAEAFAELDVGRWLPGPGAEDLKPFFPPEPAIGPPRPTTP